MLARKRLDGTLRLVARIDVAVSLAVFALFLLVTLTGPAHAMKIQSVKSPGGIEAWLVEDHSVPLLAMRFAFEGGSAQDPKGKEGVANFLTAMLDEGAGDLDATAFQERLEELAVKMTFEDSRDSFFGNFETLSVNRDAAVGLLKLALGKPRFDAPAVERIRKQLLANLAYAEKSPDKVASKEWYKVAFEGHPYARPVNGTPETLAGIAGADLEAYRKRVFARSNLKVVAVGDIDAATLGRLLDDVFGALPAKAELEPVERTSPLAGAKLKHFAMDVPQSVAVFGFGAMARKDPDFMPAFVLNHIVGGGGFASKLMEEVREKRGLAYSVYSYIHPEIHASVLVGSVATKAEAIDQSLEVIRAELARMSEQGPSQEDLDNAKKYLVGSYALRFDTSAKIASQLLGIMQEDLGIDYVERRNGLVEAVTLDDIKRVAKRLFKMGDLIVTVVGKPAAAPAAASSGRG
ncbi:MAG: pitrilysin family protein [Pseudomonadota bacterium]